MYLRYAFNEKGISPIQEEIIIKLEVLLTPRSVLLVTRLF